MNCSDFQGFLRCILVFFFEVWSARKSSNKEKSLKRVQSFVVKTEIRKKRLDDYQRKRESTLCIRSPQQRHFDWKMIPAGFHQLLAMCTVSAIAILLESTLFSNQQNLSYNFSAQKKSLVSASFFFQKKSDWYLSQDLPLLDSKL